MDEITLEEKEEPRYKPIMVWLPQMQFLAVEDLRVMKGERNVARWIRKVLIREIEKEKRRAHEKELADVG